MPLDHYTKFDPPAKAGEKPAEDGMTVTGQLLGSSIHIDQTYIHVRGTGSALTEFDLPAPVFAAPTAQYFAEDEVRPKAKRQKGRRKGGK
jgi:hypothetical protein